MSATPSSQGPPPGHGGLKKARAGDMVWSVLIIGIPIILISLIFTRNLGDAPVEEIEWRTLQEQADNTVDWPVLGPEGLPDTWVPIRAEWLPEGAPGLNNVASPRNHWRLGYLDPSQIYIELNQADAAVDQLVAESTRDGEPDGESWVDGEQWDRLVSEDGRTRSLVLESPEFTTIVVGDTSYDALATYITVLAG